MRIDVMEIEQNEIFRYQHHCALELQVVVDKSSTYKRFMRSTTFLNYHNMWVIFITVMTV